MTDDITFCRCEFLASNDSAEMASVDSKTDVDTDYGNLSF